MKKGLFLAFGVVLIFLFFVFSNKEEREDKLSLEQANLKFSGVVTNVNQVNGYNGRGIITLTILESNTKEYDPRDSTEFYYCVLKNGVAEVYDHTTSIQIGDTLNINTQQSLMSVGSKGHERQMGSIKISRTKSYYEYIKQHSGFVR